MITTAVREGRRVFVAGNGGSAAIADHLCCDWTKGTHTPGPVAAAHALPRVQRCPAHRDRERLRLRRRRSRASSRCSASAGDVLLLISSSGNSPNIMAAADAARAMGITTVGLTGFSGGALASRVDVSLHVPYANYGLVEDCHQILMHTFAQLFATDRESDTPRA